MVGCEENEAELLFSKDRQNEEQQKWLSVEYLWASSTLLRAHYLVVPRESRLCLPNELAVYFAFCTGMSHFVQG